MRYKAIENAREVILFSISLIVARSLCSALFLIGYSRLFLGIAGSNDVRISVVWPVVRAHE